MEFKENLKKLKLKFNVHSNKDLASILDISESSISKWTQRKSIPKRYLKLLDDNSSDIINQSGINTIGMIGGVNNGQIHINSNDEMLTELCKAIKQLEPKRQEYYFYKIKAELLDK